MGVWTYDLLNGKYVLLGPFPVTTSGSWSLVAFEGPERQQKDAYFQTSATPEYLSMPCFQNVALDFFKFAGHEAGLQYEGQLSRTASQI
jgi:hypothetical protein